MKSKVIKILILCLTASLSFFLFSCSHEIFKTMVAQSDGFKFVLDEEKDVYKISEIYEEGLSHVEIPSTFCNKPVEEISAKAFFNTTFNSSIKSVFIPASIKVIGSGAFAHCPNLESFVVDEENPHYKSINGNLYDINGTTLIHYAIGKKDESFDIPDSVNTIGDFAFAGCENLKTITMSNRVKYIKEAAFASCEHLQDLTLSSLLQSIGKGAFSSCSTFKEIILPNDLKEIGEYAFYNCKNIKSIKIPDLVRSVGKGTFEFCENLESISLSNIVYISENCFHGCKNLKNVDLPETIMSIQRKAFSNCISLTEINIPNETSKIYNNAFLDCYNLTKIRLGTGLEEIDYMAFNGCYRLVEVVNDSKMFIKKGSEENGGVALYALAVYNSSEDYQTKIVSDGDFILYNEESESVLINYTGNENAVVIPSYVTKINAYAFYDCNKIYSLVIGEKVNTIGAQAFEKCFRLVEVVSNSPYISLKKGATENGGVALYALDVYNASEDYQTKLSKIDGFILFTDGNEKILIDYNGEETNLIVEDFTKINDYAFYANKDLTSVEIGDKITEIGASAFEYCSIKTAEIGDGVKGVGDGAFRWTFALKNIVVGISVTNFGDEAFRGCDIENVYFKNDESNGNISLGTVNFTYEKANKYYYREDKSEIPFWGGNYWHYGADGQIEIW